ncbi:hypothetical protein FANTH_2181 [Fusarium anthophilum]|uniref:Peptidase A1 domain-containing protein n=1 Tax=Fusarium anthophilum TaxID=48485 RepID=A0A8H4ZUZ1_9HYPO|nr:hypothetical protein FANTH_2181 [Fusarium anthophilum]
MQEMDQGSNTNRRHSRRCSYETCKEKDCQGDIFDPEKSDSFESSEEQVCNSLGSGESWEGEYANDTFTLGSSTLDSFQFVGVTEFNATNAGAFSLWLNNETHGEFLFGGVNKAKYTGPLVTYPVAADNTFDVRDRALVVMTGLRTTSDGKTSELDFKARPVLLDAGTIQSRLSLNMTLPLITTMKVSMDEKLDAVAPCNTSSKETLDFTFRDLTLNVPSQTSSRQPQLRAVSTVWRAAKSSITKIPLVLRDDFLRAVYVVYDWDNMEISLAQYNPEEAKDGIHDWDLISRPSY